MFNHLYPNLFKCNNYFPLTKKIEFCEFIFFDPPLRNNFVFVGSREFSLELALQIN